MHAFVSRALCPNTNNQVVYDIFSSETDSRLRGNFHLGLSEIDLIFQVPERGQISAIQEHGLRTYQRSAYQ